MTTRRNKLVAAAVLCTLGALTAVANAQSNYEFNLPQQPLADALRAIGSKTTTNILFEPATVENLTAPAVRGVLSPEAAIKLVLAGTKLVVQQTSTNSLLIAPAGVQATSTAVKPLTNYQSDSSSLGGSELRLTQAETAQAPRENNSAGEANQRPENRNSDSHARIEEVIVTATKRAESSLDVPMGLTALSGQDLEREHAYRLEDFVGKVPGLTMTQTVGTQLVVRGVASTATSINAPVATYIDDTPLVGVGAFSGGSTNTPNLDTFDLSRVEVLKGPQGTLYGANALGGLLKYVTNPPDPSGFAATTQAGMSTVAESDDGTGHNLHGMVNMPLADNLALRVVGYHNEYAGYIDDPTRGVEDVNGTSIYGGRASLLWTPTADLSIRVNVLDQQRRWDGMSFVDVRRGTLEPVYCTLCQSRDTDQPGESGLRYYNVTATWDLGAAELLSSTTYDEFSFIQDRDLVGLRFLADARKGEPGSGRWGLLARFDYEGDEVVHETRLSSKLGGNWNWQAGIYYTTKDTAQDQSYLPINRLDHSVETIEFSGTTQPTTYKETAAFVNLGYQFTPAFDVSVGGRISEASQTFEQIGRTVLNPTLPLAAMSDSVFTYSADARWRLTPHDMIYARVASGFAPGGPNVAPLDAPVPPTYGSSTTTNYELGYKSSMLDNRVTLELAVFQIDWEDIQLYAPFGIYTALANGGTAVSKGVELALNYVPFTGLTLGVSGAYTDAHLTEDTPAGTGGFDGDQLPVTPKWQASASADYRWPMFGVFGFAGVDWRYSDRRFADFTVGKAREQMPSYDIVDLRAGVEKQRWTLSVYVKNVGNTLAISYVNPETAAVDQNAFYTTPRTAGVEMTVDF